MRTAAVLVSATLVLGAAGEPSPSRAVRITALVEAPPAELYRLWTTADGLRTVFPGAEARVVAEPGGEYCIAFDPASDPEGTAFGTAGCTVLELEPDRSLSFEWRGTPAHPEMNATPLPTRVTVRFEPAGAAAPAGATRLELVHSGFCSGGGWDAAFEFFESAWRGTLDGLAERYSSTPPVDVAALFAQAETLYVVRLSPGPAAGTPAADARRFANHAAYLRRLQQRGVVRCAGPVGDAGEGLALLDVPDAASAARYFAADPAVQAGLFAFTVERFTAALHRE